MELCSKDFLLGLMPQTREMDSLHLAGLTSFIYSRNFIHHHCRRWSMGHVDKGPGRIGLRPTCVGPMAPPRMVTDEFPWALLLRAPSLG